MRALLERRTLVGLRWRLAGWVAAVTLVCTGIAFVAVYRGTGTQLRAQIDGEVAGDASELAHNLTLVGRRAPKQLSRAATSYVRGRPFSASSTLLFALVPGQAVSTNRPELFARSAADSDESPAQQAAENRLAGHLLSAPLGYSTLLLPDVGNLR